MEGHELEGDDTQDALQAVHCLGKFDGLIGVLSDLHVALAAQDDWPPLMEKGREDLH